MLCPVIFLTRLGAIVTMAYTTTQCNIHMYVLQFIQLGLSANNWGLRCPSNVRFVSRMTRLGGRLRLVGAVALQVSIGSTGLTIVATRPPLSASTTSYYLSYAPWFYFGVRSCLLSIQPFSCATSIFRALISSRTSLLTAASSLRTEETTFFLIFC